VDDQLLHLGVAIEPAPDVDAVELDELRSSLRAQLLELDVHAVEQVSAGPAPEGTRALELLAGGALLVSVSKSPELLKAVFGVIQGWVSARPGRTVELNVNGNSLKMTGVTAADQERLIDAFIARSVSR
jgi:hypothetical protein